MISRPQLVRADGRFVYLHENFVIGRGSSCHMKLEDRLASRQHARLYTVQDFWHIRDIGSASGTFVNGQSIQLIRLNPGDTITIGSTNLIFRA
jgi:pSer/pThr/pTyr-binding forkhead associated (FHA) protein